MAPSGISASGGLPRRLRRSRLLIVGCGDVGLRVAARLRGRVRLLALTSDPQRVPALRAAGLVPLVGDLDRPGTLARLSALAPNVLHLAPPPSQGRHDPRTGALLQALARRGGVARIVYGSTTGVYGDCGGAWVHETRTPRPATERAHRRVDAERRLRWFGRAFGARVTLLRIPGIYALDRPGGDPRERVRRGAPVPAVRDDVYTNHVHADDLARACIAALARGRAQRVVHVNDDSQSRVGEHYTLVAALCGLPAPPRITREEAQRSLPAAVLSFWAESRRLDNTRLKRELRLVLHYPGVREALQAHTPSPDPGAGLRSPAGGEAGACGPPISP